MITEADKPKSSNTSPFEITVIGNGAAMPVAGRYHSTHEVNVHEHHYLMDCGEGTQKAMLELGMNPQKIKAIFISHLHGDHIYGLFPLMDTLGLQQRTEPLKIFAPHPLGELMDCVSRCLYGGGSYDVDLHEVDTTAHRVIYENEFMEVLTVPLLHRVPSTGYLIREKAPGLNVSKEKINEYNLNLEQILAAKRGEDIGRIPNTELTYIPYKPRSYAYCTDTVHKESVAEQVKGVNILYHEATFSAGSEELARINGHSTSIQAAEIALKAGADMLLIGHISARYKDSSQLVEEARVLFPMTEEAKEGKRYQINQEKIEL